MRTLKSFTGREALLTALAVGVLTTSAMSILFVTPYRSRALAKRAVCLNNLGNITKGMGTYEAANPRYPTPLLDSQAVYDPDVLPIPMPANQTNTQFRDDATAWAPLGSHPMQNVWLMIADFCINEVHFKCPADVAWFPRETVTAEPREFGWVSPFNYSYGMHVPNSNSGDNRAPLSRARDNLVIFADQTPYNVNGYHVIDGDARPHQYPSNHLDLGTCAATGGGSVAFGEPDHSQLGARGDEIYANESGTIAGVPESATDTSIVPSGRHGIAEAILDGLISLDGPEGAAAAP